jgi:hypothetical protein
MLPDYAVLHSRHIENNGYIRLRFLKRRDCAQRVGRSRRWVNNRLIYVSGKAEDCHKKEDYHVKEKHRICSSKVTFEHGLNGNLH